MPWHASSPRRTGQKSLPAPAGQTWKVGPIASVTVAHPSQGPSKPDTPCNKSYGQIADVNIQVVRSVQRSDMVSPGMGSVAVSASGSGSPVNRN